MGVTHCAFAAATLLAVATLTLGCDSTDSTGPPYPILPATTGAIKFTASTTGVEIGPDGYNIEMRFQFGLVTHVRVPTNGTVTIDGLLPGSYTLTIFELVPNCDPVIPSPRTVVVAAGTATPVALDVTCATPTQLAFVDGAGNDAEIYVVNSNGTGASRITTQAGADVSPAWSPDGSRIAFASQRDGNFEIYVMSANGTNPVRLTNVGAADSHPAWSPDGARIAFVSERDGNPEIYVMNADGSSPVRLTSHSASDSEPAWSPDGTRIAFVSDRDGNDEVYLMAADGSGLSRLTAFSQPDAQPVWSPDGTRIAFSRGDFFDNSHIFVINADGSGLMELTQSVVNGKDPAWSPDGRKIAFTTTYCDFYYYDYCDNVIQVVRTDGTPYVLMTPGLIPSEPTWRP
jgi:dipeptidyl aminopeptidase/acylaminoacyl peptidase